jgi:hypothetical protein
MASLRTSSAGGGTSGTGNRTATIAALQNDMLIVGVTWSANSATNPTCTDNGTGTNTYSLILTAAINGSADIFALFVRNALVAANATLTISPVVGSGTNTAGEIAIIALTGVTNVGLNAIRQSGKQENQTSGVPTPVLGNNALTGNMTVTWVGATQAGSGTITCVPNASWTEQQDAQQINPSTETEVATRASGYTGTGSDVPYVSIVSVLWASAIIEINDNPVVEEEDTFWGNYGTTVTRSIASAAAASCIFSSALASNLANSQQDEATTPPPIMDEDFWQNPVPPVIRSFYRQLPYLPDPEELPSGSLATVPGEADNVWQVVQQQLPWKIPPFIEDDFVPAPQVGLDEDYWQNPVLPKLYPTYKPPPVQDDSDFPTPVAAAITDEDFWIPAKYPLIPQAIPLFFLTDSPMAGTPSAATVDEDYWTQPGQAAPPDLWVETLFLPYVLGAGDDAFSQVEELYWQNPVPPVQSTLKWPQQHNFIHEDIVPIPAPPEEDFWINPVKPVPATLIWPQQHNFIQDEQPSLMEELYWQNSVAPVPATLRLFQQWPNDNQEPSGALFGEYDEDFWQNPVKPTPASLIWTQQWPNDVQEPAGSLFGQYDEDFWVNPVPPIPFKLRPLNQWEMDIQEPTQGLAGQPDEDYWINPVRPIQATLLWPQPHVWDIQEPSGSLLAEFDEDFWINPVAPVKATLYQRLPYVPDPTDYSVGIAEEDCWQNPVKPTPATLKRLDPFVFETEPPATLAGLVTEDYWVNPVFPIPASNKLSLPHIPDRDENTEIVPLSVTIDEEPWQNPVRPVWMTFRYPQQQDFADDSQGDGYLFIPPDESYWANPIPPVLATLRSYAPWLTDNPEPSSLCHVTGIIEDLTGAGIPGFVKFRLTNFGDTIPRIIGTTTVAKREYTVHADATGYFSLTLWGNDNINPSGTFYIVSVYNQYHSLMSSNDFSITGGSFDLTTATPL